MGSTDALETIGDFKDLREIILRVPMQDVGFRYAGVVTCERTLGLSSGNRLLQSRPVTCIDPLPDLAPAVSRQL